jgi:ribonuclease G
VRFWSRPASPLTEWIYERGIGEARAALIDGDRILEALIEPDDVGLRVGDVARGRLADAIIKGSNARVIFDDGTEALLDGVPTGVSEGRSLFVRIVREAIPERGRPKLAKAVAEPDATAPIVGPDLLKRLEETPHLVRHLQSHQPDDLEAAGWSELLEEAIWGEIAFPGGALRMSVTPAMTLFDVDGSLPAAQLAIVGARAVSRAIVRHGVGGSIGVDFPTLPDRAARKAVDAIIDQELLQPFERTGMNGFGFMQIIRRRTGASLPERLRADPAKTELLAALRRAERDPPGDGIVRLGARALALIETRANWQAELARRLGRPMSFQTL